MSEIENSRKKELGKSKEEIKENSHHNEAQSG